MNYEFPLVFFTVLTQLGIGLALVGAWKTCFGGSLITRRFWLTALAATLAGLVASLFHLGDPLRAATALNGLGHSWLSREGLVFGLFVLLLLLAALRPGRAAAALPAALAGLAALVVQGFTYAPVSMPAISNGFPLLLFVLTALALGMSFGAAAAGPQRLTLSLLLVVLLIVPCLWASGSAIMQDTAALWRQSAGFWAGLVLTAAALVLSLVCRQGTRAQGVLLLCGALLVRVAFFSATVHTATRLGMPY